MLKIDNSSYPTFSLAMTTPFSADSLICRIFQIIRRALLTPSDWFTPTSPPIKVTPPTPLQQPLAHQFIQSPYTKTALTALAIGGGIYFATRVDQPIRPSANDSLAGILAGIICIAALAGTNIYTFKQYKLNKESYVNLLTSLLKKEITILEKLSSKITKRIELFPILRSKPVKDSIFDFHCNSEPNQAEQKLCTDSLAYEIQNTLDQTRREKGTLPPEAIKLHAQLQSEVTSLKLILQNSLLGENHFNLSKSDCAVVCIPECRKITEKLLSLKKEIVVHLLKIAPGLEEQIKKADWEYLDLPLRNEQLHMPPSSPNLNEEENQEPLRLYFKEKVESFVSEFPSVQVALDLLLAMEGNFSFTQDVFDRSYWKSCDSSTRLNLTEYYPEILAMLTCLKYSRNDLEELLTKTSVNLTDSSSDDET